MLVLGPPGKETEQTRADLQEPLVQRKRAGARGLRPGGSPRTAWAQSVEDPRREGVRGHGSCLATVASAGPAAEGGCAEGLAGLGAHGACRAAPGAPPAPDPPWGRRRRRAEAQGQRRAQPGGHLPCTACSARRPSRGHEGGLDGRRPGEEDTQRCPGGGSGSAPPGPPSIQSPRAPGQVPSHRGETEVRMGPGRAPHGGKREDMVPGPGRLSAGVSAGRDP